MDHPPLWTSHPPTLDHWMTMDHSLWTAMGHPTAHVDHHGSLLTTVDSPRTTGTPRTIVDSSHYRLLSATVDYPYYGPLCNTGPLWITINHNGPSNTMNHYGLSWIMEHYGHEPLSTTMDYCGPRLLWNTMTTYCKGIIVPHPHSQPISNPKFQLITMCQIRPT